MDWVRPELLVWNPLWITSNQWNVSQLPSRPHSWHTHRNFFQGQLGRSLFCWPNHSVKHSCPIIKNKRKVFWQKHMQFCDPIMPPPLTLATMGDTTHNSIFVSSPNVRKANRDGIIAVQNCRCFWQKNFGNVNKLLFCKIDSQFLPLDRQHWEDTNWENFLIQILVNLVTWHSV